MNIIEKALQGNRFFGKKDLFLVEKLASFLFTKKIKKRELLLKEGEINDRMFYVQKGLLRVYFINDDGKEINTWFVKEGEFVYACHSFHFQIPSEEYIEAMEDSEIMSIKKETWLMLLRNNHKLALFTVHELMANIAEFATQASVLRLMTGEKKYEYLKTHKSDILERISQKHLASYLGVDTTYLSKIINNYKNNEENKNIQKAI
ncbi:Crp/Fnr family transcriptional regulator [Flavobacterium sp.]|uniref:Crp/Fnr family transcriptional regulator n=1 Tax=Flavobacterium sp. TaxID=239 RepID=UPI00286EEB00|nr:Crp/Fnr family transcriptional regulator [Flavobacterium sp.]